MVDIDMAENLGTMLKNEVEIIAEVGQAHDGSLGILYSYIDALSEVGVDTIKFQIHIADAESSDKEAFRVPFSYEDKKRIDYWRRMEFSSSQWDAVKKYCEGKGVEFLASPFSIAAVELLEEIGVSRYKIGSGEVRNFLMLDKIARTGKPIILSSGMSSFQELEEAVRLIAGHHDNISIMQCTTAYPTPAEKIGFNVLAELKSRFPKYKIGLSEHTSTISTGIAAVALGAELLEFHAVFDKRMFGPDASSSLTIDEVEQLVDGIRFIEKALQHPVDKNDLRPYEEIKPIFEKSLAVRFDLKAGHTLTYEDLETKKPAGQGIPASAYKSVVGKKLKGAKEKNSFLTEADLLKP
jgi:N-acetylneuraminate synthase